MTSLKGFHLPESYEEFITLVHNAKTQHQYCVECQQGFNRFNTYSAPGWRDTQIIGMCEVCFDSLFADKE